MTKVSFSCVVLTRCVFVVASAIVTLGCRDVLGLQDKTICERDSDCPALCGARCVARACTFSKTGGPCGADGAGRCNEGGACMHRDVTLTSNYRHTCARMHDGRLWCWGGNGEGQLGDGTLNDRLNPIRIEGLPLVLNGPRTVGLGYGHTCIVGEDGTVWCWGNNEGSQSSATQPPSPRHLLKPMRIGGLPPAKEVVAGYGHTCALTVSGEIYCWGYDSFGQCGQPAHDVIAPPAKVPSIGPALDVMTIKNHTCAIENSGRLLCWGDNASGEIGTRTSADNIVAVPTQVDLTLPTDSSTTNTARGIGLSFESTCAIRNDRQSVVCWGKNDLAQVGNGKVSAIERTPSEVVVSGGGQIHGRWLISTSASFGCAYDDSGEQGILYCWGTTWPGQLGKNLSRNATDGIQHVSVVAEPIDLPYSVAFGDQHGCALFGSDVPIIECFGRGSNVGRGADAGAQQLDPEPVIWLPEGH